MATTTIEAPARFEIIPFLSVLPIEWETLGFKRKQSAVGSNVAGRFKFVVRQGYDPIDQSSTGRVLEAESDMGVSLRLNSIAAALTASSLAFRGGLDDPLAQSSSSAPSMKATVAHEFSPDSFIAAGFDFKQRKPDLSICWTGETFTEKATVCLQVSDG